MAAILLTPGTSKTENSLSTCTCLFCHKSSFKRLGNHLPHCPERNGRDYAPFLSKKTLCNRKKANSCKKRLCPRCHKRFCRLDTHLRNSATCRLVVSSDKAFLTSPSPSAMEDGSVSPSPNTLSTQPLTEPLESCYSPQPQTSPADTTPDSVPKPRPCLPVSDDDWEKANTYFKNEKH